MNILTIEGYLKKYGWEFHQSEDDVILTDFMSEDIEAVFLVVIQLASPWLRLSIPAYLPLQTDKPCLDLCQQILKMNYLSRQVYFALGNSNEFILCTDLYVGSGLVYETFEIALDSLTYVAETAYTPLMNLIHSVANKI